MTLTWPRRAGLGEPKQMVAVGNLEFSADLGAGPVTLPVLMHKMPWTEKKPAVSWSQQKTTFFCWLVADLPL